MIADAVLHSRVRRESERKLWFHTLSWSLILHTCVVFMATAEWSISTGKQFGAPVYSVELVSLETPASEKQTALRPRSTAKSAVRPKAIPIRRFQAKKEPLLLKKLQRAVLPGLEEKESEPVEKALTKIEKRPPPPPPTSEKPRRKPQPSASDRKQVSLVNIGGIKGGELSQALGLYRALVNEKIESNWVFPEHLNSADGKLEAIVVVRARRDGAVLDMQFEKKSGDPYFDDSVLKAILKSKPFPPFPDIYSPKEEEIVVRFSPPNERS